MVLIRTSELYRTYAASFRMTTGLPLDLRPIEAVDLPHHDQPNENRFCSIMARDGRNCSMCLQMQARFDGDATGEGVQTFVCFAGLAESSVPLRLGEEVIGYLRTGQVLLRAPSRTQFTRIWRHLPTQGGDAEFSEVESAYFGSRVLEPEQYDAAVRLLAIFGQQLSVLARQLMVRTEPSESPSVMRARAYIAANIAEELSLDAVARVSNMSPYHFCKIFKQTTGRTFTDYVSHVRIERAKELLRDEDRRISEVAFEVGFQSLSQFNRVFRAIMAEPPTRYRERLHEGHRGMTVA